jgi:hypothetical protein
MKIFLLFAATIIFLLAANPSKTVNDSDKKDSVPASCSKNKCNEKESKGEQDDFYPLQFNLFHT